MQPTRRPEAFDMISMKNGTQTVLERWANCCIITGRIVNQPKSSNSIIYVWLAGHPGQSGAEQLRSLHLYNRKAGFTPKFTYS